MYIYKKYLHHLQFTSSPKVVLLQHSFLFTFSLILFSPDENQVMKNISTVNIYIIFFLLNYYLYMYIYIEFLFLFFPFFVFLI